MPQELEEFYGDALWGVAYGDEGDEGVGAEAEDGEVTGGFVGHEEHGGLGDGLRKIEAHGVGGGADVDGLANAAIDDVHGEDAAGGAIGDVHFGGVFGEDGASGSGAEEHGVAYFVRPGVDGFENVGFGRDDVEFAAVGFHKHLRGAAGKLEVCEQDGAAEIDDGKAALGAAHDEGDGAVGKDGDFVGLRDDFDNGARLERGGVVDGERRGAAIYDEDGFLVGRDAGLYGLGVRAGAA